MVVYFFLLLVVVSILFLLNCVQNIGETFDDVTTKSIKDGRVSKLRETHKKSRNRHLTAHTDAFL